MSDLSKITSCSLRIEGLLKKICEKCLFERAEIVDSPYNCIYENFAMCGKSESENFKQFMNKYGFMSDKSMEELVNENFSFEDMLKDLSNL